MDIDVDVLIIEVEKRNALYDTNTHLYNDRRRKKELWDEICAILDKKWTTYSSEEKSRYAKEVQKRWNSLRDCFRREVTYQNNLPSGNDVKRKAKYKYFDSLLFLLPFTKVTSTDSSVQDIQEEEKRLVSNQENVIKREKNEHNRKRGADVEQETLMSQNDNVVKKITSLRSRETKETKTIHKAEHDNNDDDLAFLMSLLPTFKDFTIEEKILLRIELMQTIMRFKVSREMGTIYSGGTINAGHFMEQKYDVTQASTSTTSCTPNNDYVMLPEDTTQDSD